MIKLTDVQKNYKGFSLDVSMNLKRGNISGLIGANGAGKSCTYKAILGLIHPDGGNIEIFGKNISELTTEDRRKIGVVLAESGFSGYLTAKDVAAVLKDFYPEFDRSWFFKKCEEELLPVNKQIKDLSTGMKIKLKVISAMSHRAELLILDEPVANLDVIARENILTMLQDYMDEDENRGILISSHISSDLESICDDLYMINNGKIIFHEETDKLINEYGMLKISEDAYESLDKKYLLCRKKEPFGISVMTDNRKFYMDNYPEIIVEKGSIDNLILMMIKGEAI